VVLLVCVVVTGLLRSHADILRSLHQLGVGVGDPTARTHPVGPQTVPMPRAAVPPLPSERSSDSAHDIEGVTVGGDAVAISVHAAPLTLFAFLSSGCSSCAAMWTALGDEEQLRMLPQGARVVAVTKGPEFESPSAVAARAPRGLTVVMSTAAWGDYEVPGSPFFVLVDGGARRRVGEGVANQFAQIADLVRRAAVDAGPPGGPGGQGRQGGQGGQGGRGGRGTTSRAGALGLDGAEREAANDQELAASGITPGHPSLYPRSLEDVFASTAPLGAHRGPRHVDVAAQRDPA
jgi:hypothetical protein